jgi:glycerate kinase
MRILVAPDKFKGSLSAPEAARAIEEGWRETWPDCEIIRSPIADGGEGFAEVFRDALGGEWRTTTASDPIGRPLQPRYALIAAHKLAVIEMSEASGLWRLQRTELAPLRANTFGTGELIRDALQQPGVEQLFIGLGGSATTDGGIGMAAALGFEFHDADGSALEPVPANLRRIVKILRPPQHILPRIVAACDVSNPLLGPKGTAHIFGPQKGADPATVAELERGLENLANVAARDLDADHRDFPGAGAAGGIGFGLLTFCGATLQSGFDLVAETVGLTEKIAACDLVITGEGRLDSQTLDGKGPGGVARLARKAGKPVLALAGSVEEGLDGGLYDWAFPIVDASVPLEHAMANAATFLREAAGRAARHLRAGPLAPRASQAAPHLSPFSSST